MEPRHPSSSAEPDAERGPRSPKYSQWLQAVQRSKEKAFAHELVGEDGEQQSLKGHGERLAAQEVLLMMSRGSTPLESSFNRTKPHRVIHLATPPPAPDSEVGENIKKKIEGIEKWMGTQSSQMQALQSALRDLPKLAATSSSNADRLDAIHATAIETQRTVGTRPAQSDQHVASNADRLDAILAAVMETQRSVAAIESAQQNLQKRLQQVETALHSGARGGRALTGEGTDDGDDQLNSLAVDTNGNGQFDTILPAVKPETSRPAPTKKEARLEDGSEIETTPPQSDAASTGSTASTVDAKAAFLETAASKWNAIRLMLHALHLQPRALQTESSNALKHEIPDQYHNIPERLMHSLKDSCAKLMKEPSPGRVALRRSKSD